MWEKIPELKNKFLSDPLSKGIFIIASGSVIGQVISVITTLITTRLYSPADFGVLGLFSSTLTVLALTGGFAYEMALPLPKEDEDAANLFLFFLIVLAVTSLCFIIVCVLWVDPILSFFHITALKSYVLLLIIGFLGISLYGALTYWVARRRDYTRITYTKIYQSFGGSVTKISLGILGAGPIGLLGGAVLSQMLGVGTLFRYMWEKDRVLFKSLSVSRMVENAKRYIQFPVFAFPSGIINAIALQLPVFMLSAIYGLNVVGMYTLAYSVLVLTSSLISTSMGQVYFAEVSKMTRENSRELKELFLQTTRKLFLIGTPLIIIPSLLAPFLFPVVFGPVWSEGGWYCLPLAIVAIANFVVSPTSVLLCYGFNHWALIWDVSRTLLLLFSFYLIQMFSLPVLIALFIYSIIMAVMYGVNYLMNIWAIDLHLQRSAQ